VYGVFSQADEQNSIESKRGYEKVVEFMRRFVRAGGLVLAGSDPIHGMPALDIHEEVTMFVEAGLTPMQAKELRAKIPPQMIKNAGTFPVTVVSPGESGGRSTPVHLIVTFAG
jgi:hypothetical protein